MHGNSYWTVSKTKEKVTYMQNYCPLWTDISSAGANYPLPFIYQISKLFKTQYLFNDYTNCLSETGYQILCQFHGKVTLMSK